MNLTICIGSSCHLKGSKTVAKTFERMIAENNLQDKIEFSAAFCMGNCQKGISVSVNDVIHSVTPETAEEFFRAEVLSRL